MSSEITIKGYVSSKSLVTDSYGNKYIMISIVEEKESPGIVISGSDEVAQIAKQVIPLVQQLLKSFPTTAPLVSNKVHVPRIHILLTEDEIEYLGGLDVGDYVEIKISSGKIEIIKQI